VQGAGFSRQEATLLRREPTRKAVGSRRGYHGDIQAASSAAAKSARRGVDRLSIESGSNLGVRWRSVAPNTSEVSLAIDTELSRDITQHTAPATPVDQLQLGIDGAFVKGKAHCRRLDFEVLTGPIEVVGRAPGRRSRSWAILVPW